MLKEIFAKRKLIYIQSVVCPHTIPTVKHGKAKIDEGLKHKRFEKVVFNQDFAGKV